MTLVSSNTATGRAPPSGRSSEHIRSIPCGDIGAQPAGILANYLERQPSYWATNEMTVSEFTRTVYFSPDSKSEPRGTTVSTAG